MQLSMDTKNKTTDGNCGKQIYIYHSPTYIVTYLDRAEGQPALHESKLPNSCVQMQPC